MCVWLMASCMFAFTVVGKGRQTLPLDEAAASMTLRNVTADLDNDGVVSLSLPESLLELWLHRAAMTTPEFCSLCTDTLVQYMKMCCVTVGQ